MSTGRVEQVMPFDVQHNVAVVVESNKLRVHKFTIHDSRLWQKHNTELVKSQLMLT